jgi:hypothetical protein
MRRALIVGIDNYPCAPLKGCVNDANKITELLSKHQDGSPNFGCKKMIEAHIITSVNLKQWIEELFKDETDIALFYFSGHGTENNLGGYIVTPNITKYDEGVAMRDIITFANKSKAHEIIIILDCCHSGSLGNPPDINNDVAMLREGVSILTASRATQTAMEEDSGGVFTNLLCNALDGGASDVIGRVTMASVYAYIDQSLGAWEQRPLFKAHVCKLTCLRNCEPEIPLPILRLLPKYFFNPKEEYKLDPSYEPDADPPNPENEEIFGHLQKYRAARLLVPVGEEHMYYAAINCKSCKLTSLGQFYWKLAKDGRI